MNERASRERRPYFSDEGPSGRKHRQFAALGCITLSTHTVKVVEEKSIFCNSSSQKRLSSPPSTSTTQLATTTSQAPRRAPLQRREPTPLTTTERQAQSDDRTGDLGADWRHTQRVHMRNQHQWSAGMDEALHQGQERKARGIIFGRNVKQRVATATCRAGEG